jgi:hypothetical protein
MNAGGVEESERFVLVVRQIVAAMIVMLAWDKAIRSSELMFIRRATTEGRGFTIARVIARFFCIDRRDTPSVFLVAYGDGKDSGELATFVE